MDGLAIRACIDRSVRPNSFGASPTYYVRRNILYTEFPFSEMPCSLKAQLQRLFIPTSVKELVDQDDLMVTTDVDTFVMKSDIFDEVLMRNRGKIGILRVTTTNKKIRSVKVAQLIQF